MLPPPAILRAGGGITCTCALPTPFTPRPSRPPLPLPPPCLAPPPRPRVNGVQLKVLQGARLPEEEGEWGELLAALRGVRMHLRPNTSVELVMSELRGAAAAALDWWTNRKKQEGERRACGWVGAGGAGRGSVRGWSREGHARAAAQQAPRARPALDDQHLISPPAYTHHTPNHSPPPPRAHT